MQTFDFLVVGSGPAGQHAAIQAAKLGKQVALVERGAQVGGVTVHTGTIPSKTLREAILYLSGWRQRGIYGRDYRVKQSITAEDLARRLQFTIQHEVKVIEDQLQRNGVVVVHGAASFADSNTIQVADPEGTTTRYRANRIFLATGTRPRRPENIPFDDDSIIDSDGILNLREIPKSIVIYGAGVIGVEYASMFNALDVEVTLVDTHEQILPFIDKDVMNEFAQHMSKCGMRLLLGEKLESVERDDQGKVVANYASGNSDRADAFLFTAGRIGCTSTLKLDKAGLTATDRHQLTVNENYQTDVPHIYAGGDLIGFPSLASTSMEQGRIAACHAFNESCNRAPAHFPYGIYSVPEISMIGRTEQDLGKEGIAFHRGVARFRETARGQIMGIDEGLLKLLVAQTDHRILGVHIVGEGATELIHIGQAVMMLNGTLDYFIENAFNYPTLAETYKIAALNIWNHIR
ncbi:MAG: Si-specific NAD(P)(+) transhydrogenase [Acidiferrobacterales bacterium]|jgi:NAD(P) transhydrogenase|nr:Si-specific NAD(P)(+) transhydrogenase [Acidiferrobacterales bacterium]